MGFKDFLGILQWKKAETNHFTEDLGDTSHKIGYTDLSWLVQDWVYPKIAKWCTVPTKNGGIPPKTLENQVDSVRMWTKNIPQLLFCLQTVHTGIPWIPSFHGQAQAWVRSSRFWWESKMPVRVPGSQGPERSRGDPEGGGQIPVMHPANMAWFGDFLCQKRRCSIFPKVRYLRLASVGEDFLIFWNSLGCGPAQNWSFKYEHWRHVEFILVYESTGDDSSCWESCSFKIPQPPHATRQKKCRHGSRFSSKVDLLCLSNGFHGFSLFL